MKKVKPEKSTVPISLSAKKTGALKHQMLFTPYKIEWKNVPSQTVSQTSSRTFFNSMKNQLSSLKNDVQKLIKKQNSKVQNKSLRAIVLDDTPNSKSGISQKTQGSANKLQNSRQLQSDVQTGKFQQKMLSEVVNLEIINNLHTQQQNNYTKADFDRLAKQLAERQMQIDHLSKQNRLQKNLISQLKKQNHELYMQAQNKQQLVKNLQIYESQDKIKQKQLENLFAKNVQIQGKLLNFESNYEKLNLKNRELQNELESKKTLFLNQNQQLKKLNEQLKSHNIYLQQKIQNLSEKMSLVSGKFKQKQFYIREMEAKLQALRIAKKQYQLHQETDKIKINDECRKQFEQKQKQIKSKYQREYKKMEISLKQKIRQLQILNENAQQKFRQQNLALIYKCKQLQQCILLHQNGKITKNQQIDFKHLGAEFQRKINQFVEQNYNLKNKVTSLQSDIQRLQVQKGLLNDEIRIYQQIKQQSCNNQKNQTKWDKMIQQIQTLKKEKEDLIQQYEFKIMKLQNQLQNSKSKEASQIQTFDNGYTILNFNKLFKDQLQQNQQLKQKLRDQITKTNQAQLLMKQQQQKYVILSQELAVFKMNSALMQKNPNKKQSEVSNTDSQNAINKLKYQLDLLKKKYESINAMVESKNKQIRAKDQFIQKVLISKAGKKEQEDEIAYVLNEVKIFSQSIIN